MKSNCKIFHYQKHPIYTQIHVWKLFNFFPNHVENLPWTYQGRGTRCRDVGWCWYGDRKQVCRMPAAPNKDLNQGDRKLKHTAVMWEKHQTLNQENLIFIYLWNVSELSYIMYAILYSLKHWLLRALVFSATIPNKEINLFYMWT